MPKCHKFLPETVKYKVTASEINIGLIIGLLQLWIALNIGCNDVDLIKLKVNRGKTGPVGRGLLRVTVSHSVHTICKS